MNKRIKYTIRNTLRFILGRNNYIKIRFLLTHGYWGDFKKPFSWNEKVQHRKLYCEPTIFANLVDKFHVREYVNKTIGENYLIPLIAKFDTITPQDFDKFPNEFVLKTSHGGGGENVKVVSSKQDLDVANNCDLFNSYLNKKLGKYVDELFYDINEPLIIVEERIKNKDLSTLLDYKFHVFKSTQGTKVFLQINSNYGKVNETKTLYELTGEISDIQFSGYKYGPKKIQLPRNFDKMTELAVQLSGSLNYSRVDLYNVDGDIYFGEITLCPASGWDKLNTKEHDFYLGALWGEEL
jgi:hypothetical protein